MPTLNEALTVNTIRGRLRQALRTGSVYVVREAVIDLLADMGSGRVFVPDEIVDECAPTLRCPAGPDFEPESAPPVPLERPTGGP